MKTRILLLASLFAFFVSCSTIRTSIDYDRSIDFTSYKTFSIYDKGIGSLKLNDLDKKRIKESIIQQMQIKGLQYVADGGSLMINARASSKEVTQINQDNWGWGWGWQPWGMPGNTWTHVYEEGTIVLDLVDNTKNMLVWEGTGTGLNVSQIERKAVAIPEAIQKILDKYPPVKK